MQILEASLHMHLSSAHHAYEPTLSTTSGQQNFGNQILVQSGGGDPRFDLTPFPCPQRSGQTG